METQEPRRVVGQWLDWYERTTAADAAAIDALKDEIRRMNPAQLERFALWLEERHGREAPWLYAAADERASGGLRGFGLQPFARSKRRTSLPGLRLSRAGL